MTQLRTGTLAGVVAALVVLLAGDHVAAAVDFESHYAKGRVLLRRKLYFDAVRELRLAVYKTKRGKRHFGAHYFLALAYFKLPHIEAALQVINDAQKLARSKRKKKFLERVLSQIKQLYGRMAIVPEVDPEELGGKLMVSLKPKIPFNRRHKARYFAIMTKLMQRRGGLALGEGKWVWLPKGDYLISVARPRCLVYSLQDPSGKKPVGEISIGDTDLKLALRAASSCQCGGGQQVKKEGKKVYCACPLGTAWSKESKRCIVPVVTKGTWMGRNWPWVTVAAVALVGGGVVAFAATRGEPGTLVRVGEPTGLRLWQSK